MECLICSSNQVKIRYQGVDGFRIDRKFDIYSCRTCKVSFTHPFLTDEEYSEFHNAHQVAFNGVGDNDLVDEYINNKEIYWRKLRFIKRLSEIKKIHPNANSILDIGCGAGFFLDYLKNNGYIVSGIELSPWGYSVAKKTLNLNVKNSLIEDIKPPKKKLDIITMYDVIEHTTDPLNTLDSVKKWLNKNGYLIINLPNIDSFVSKASGKYWNKLSPPDHTLHFNRYSISHLLNKSGYKIVNIATNSGSAQESMSQLAGGLWRVPARFSNSLTNALDLQNKSFSQNKSAAVAAIKGSKKVAEGLGFAAKPLIPVINKMGKGEGLRVIAQPV